MLVLSTFSFFIWSSTRTCQGAEVTVQINQTIVLACSAANNSENVEHIGWYRCRTADCESKWDNSRIARVERMREPFVDNTDFDIYVNGTLVIKRVKAVDDGKLFICKAKRNLTGVETSTTILKIAKGEPVTTTTASGQPVTTTAASGIPGRSSSPLPDTPTSLSSSGPGDISTSEALKPTHPAPSDMSSKDVEFLTALRNPIVLALLISLVLICIVLVMVLITILTKPRYCHQNQRTQDESENDIEGNGNIPATRSNKRNAKAQVTYVPKSNLLLDMEVLSHSDCEPSDLN